jgi:hypothetical protein
MRKLILITALLLASASAQAGESSHGLLLADNAPPPAISTNMRHPLPPVAKNDKDDSAKTDERAEQARAAARARRMAARYGSYR